jgi:outer membrane protein TolC
MSARGLIPWILLASCAAPPSGFTARLGEWEQMASSTTYAPGASAELGANAGLAAHIRYAERENPGLRAAFDRWHAALQRVPQVTSLPDPRLTLGLFVDEVETRTGPMDARLSISQAFPWFGKLAAAGGRAFERSEEAREAFEAERLDLEHRVRDAWYEYAWLEAAILVTEGHLTLIQQWEMVALSRYETAVGSQADVIRAQVELGKLDDRLRTLIDLRRPIVADLNAALGRPSSTPIAAPRGGLPRESALDEAGLIEGLAQTSPRLRALDRRVRAAEYAVTLAEKEFYPDFALGLDYTFIGGARMPGVSGSGDDAMAVTLGLDLPIYRARYKAGLSQAWAERSAARGALADARHKLVAKLEMALYRLRDADRRIDLFREALVPKGEESVGATTAAYRAGNASFLDLIDAERVLLEFELSVARAASDHAQSLAEVERLVGLSLHEDS